MQKALRIAAGVVLVGLVLRAADLASRDCRVAPYVFDDCMWIGLHARFGLPASRFLRMAIMEGVGIVLVSVLYLAFRYVFPFRKGKRSSPDSSAPLISDPPKS